LGTNADAVVLTKEINMKIKTQIISIAILTVVLIGIAIYVDGPDRGSRGGSDVIGSGYVMMGGYEAGHGMMEEYGSSDNKHYSRDAWYRPMLSPREYDQNFSNRMDEIESLNKQIQEKRKELSYLLRSDNADKALIERKSEELNYLERHLDEKISSF
jgi:hypothetical protein